jgi:putative hydrolase of the HAD superfamily
MGNTEVAMKKLNSILFDLDETLIMEWKSAEQAFFETMGLFDHRINKNDFVKVIRTEAKNLWYALPTIEYSLQVGISSWEALWADFSGKDPNLKSLSRLSKQYRVECWHRALQAFDIPSITLAEELSNQYIKIRSTKHVLFPETLETLRLLQPNYKLGLITNGAPDLQWKKIKGGGLTDYFNCILISGEYGFGKPDERLFRAAVEQLKTVKENVLMVGDSINNDIQGAVSAGLTTVWINRERRINPAVLPNFEIDNLLKLAPILGTKL